MIFYGKYIDMSLVFEIPELKSVEFPLDFFRSGQMSDDLGEWKDLYNKGLIDDDELLARPFDATVVERLKTDPEYKDELLKEIIELIQIGELKTAQILLNTIIEVDK